MEFDLPKDSLIIASLFHDIGKTSHPMPDGSLIDYYIRETEQWKIEKGNVYFHNPEIPYMTVPLRGIFICQHYGLQLTNDEFLSIYLDDGFSIDANKHYLLKINTLPWIIQTADYAATMSEKSAKGWSKT